MEAGKLEELKRYQTGVFPTSVQGFIRSIVAQVYFSQSAKTKKAIVQLTEESADIEIFEGL